MNLGQYGITGNRRASKSNKNLAIMISIQATIASFSDLKDPSTLCLKKPSGGLILLTSVEITQRMKEAKSSIYTSYPMDPQFLPKSCSNPAGSSAETVISHEIARYSRIA
ncbi:hypothetical protein KFK09_024115 [Dendrobium nobile]|uniref:Uncharacterized protein n=1 Tax=Dendrobium nobile TaxID=94219 RepID=A0A8T3AIF1_DENNO|nr:hypothetical protein KFK09_024115 [Dendrobium nobile]